MKFKKYIAAGLIAATATGLTSCSDDFLDEKLSSSYDTSYFETENGILALTKSLYGHIRWIGGYESQGYYQFMGGTDEFGIGTDASNEVWLTYDVRMSPSFTTTNGNTGTNAHIWDEVYYGIASANKIIASADKISNEEVRNSALAQAYFLRGYNYYILTSQFGHCVLQTVPTDGIVRSFDLTTEQQCWEQVIADLRQAYSLFDGENNKLVGQPVSWTKATAAHFLAKALLFAASERNDYWNGAVKEAYLKEALEAADYAIGARQLESNVTDLYGNWTGVNCELERSGEILMVAAHDNNFSGRTASRNPGAFFNPQFSNFAKSTLGSMRGCITGGKDFQRFRPTEYTISVFDNVNDARLWKSFATVYGTAVEYAGNAHTGLCTLATHLLSLSSTKRMSMLSTSSDSVLLLISKTPTSLTRKAVSLKPDASRHAKVALLSQERRTSLSLMHGFSTRKVSMSVTDSVPSTTLSTQKATLTCSRA